METIDIVLWIAVGVFVSIATFYLFLKLAMNMLIHRIAQDMETLEAVIGQQQHILARVELHNNVFFVYNNETNEFMAQGTTLPELRDRIKLRWSACQVSVVAGDPHVIDQLKELS